MIRQGDKKLRIHWSERNADVIGEVPLYEALESFFPHNVPFLSVSVSW
jgi:hypothetical protein